MGDFWILTIVAGGAVGKVGFTDKAAADAAVKKICDVREAHLGVMGFLVLKGNDVNRRCLETTIGVSVSAIVGFDLSVA